MWAGKKDMHSEIHTVLHTIALLDAWRCPPTCKEQLEAVRNFGEDLQKDTSQTAECEATENRYQGTDIKLLKRSVEAWLHMRHA